MFRGNHSTRIDEEGRLKLPAEFKRVIDEKYGQQYYITSLDGKVAQVYPFEEWERIKQKLGGSPTSIQRRRSFWTGCVTTGTGSRWTDGGGC